ncbi:MAG: Arc family DNA-binding protein [Clostridiaceae bacterium]|jgi:hypothetical protein|nr:Arc family DNA-binding protein [Clostridiaceae bacterium]
MTIDKTRFTLRLDEQIYNKIKVISELDRRSINAQIEFFLEQSIEEYEKQHGKIDTDPEK